MQPGFSTPLNCAATSPQAPTGTQRITKSASRAPSATDLVTASAMPRVSTRSRTASDASMATTLRARPFRRVTLARDDPISPRPTMAMVSKTGAASAGPSLSGTGPILPHELGEHRQDMAVRLFGPDGEPERMRQPIGRHAAQHEAAAAEE